MAFFTGLFAPILWLTELFQWLLEDAKNRLWYLIESVIPSMVTIQKWVYEWLSYLLDVLEQFLPGDLNVSQYFDAAIELIRPVGMLVAFTVQWLVPMPFLSAIVAAGLLWAPICASLRVLMFIKGHIWSASS
jgi:hypothetical protein